MEKIELASLFANIGYDEKFRLYRDLWGKAGNYEILTSFPLHLDIELSGICNLKCESCFQNGLINGPLGLMETDLFKKIIDEGVEKGLCAVKLQIRGESFLHPKLFECIAYAKSKGILDVQITTNGTLLDKDSIQKVLNSGLDAIILSVDAHHGDSFEQKRSVKDYSSVERAIKDLLELRTKFGKSGPWVRLRSSIPDSDPESYQKTKSYLKKKFPEADIFIVGRIHDFRDNTDAFPDLHKNYKFHPCSYLTQRLAVFWDGDVTLCCMDYNNRFQLGNITSQTIEDIWLSDKIADFRKLHIDDKRKNMPICRHCHACASPVNENIISDNTKHHMADYA